MGERFEKGDVLRVPIGVTLGVAEHYGVYVGNAGK